MFEGGEAALDFIHLVCAESGGPEARSLILGGDPPEWFGVRGRLDARPRTELPRRLRTAEGETATTERAQGALVEARRSFDRAPGRTGSAQSPDQPADDTRGDHERDH